VRRSVVLLITICSILCHGQVSTASKDSSGGSLHIPNESVAPSGFDYGKMTEQGNLNEYRIGKLEEDVKSIKATIDGAKGAWWAIGSAVVIIGAMLGLMFKFLGKHIAFELVDHYAKQTPKNVTAADHTSISG
jgi:hypothetical protein